jgi:hypothetical protein
VAALIERQREAVKVTERRAESWSGAAAGTGPRDQEREASAGARIGGGSGSEQWLVS